MDKANIHQAMWPQVFYRENVSKYSFLKASVYKQLFITWEE